MTNDRLGGFSVERKFPGDELFMGNFTLGEFARNPIRNFFMRLAFCLSIQFDAWKC